MLLEFPDGTFGMLDFNYEPRTNFALEPPGLTFLRERHRKSPVKLAFICLSHPDLDHIKGVEKVIEWLDDTNISVDRIWMYPGLSERNLRTAHKSAAEELKRIVRQNEAEGITTPPGFPTNSEIKRVKKDLEAIWDFANRRGIIPQLLQGIVRLANLSGGVVEVCPMAPLSNHIDAANESTLRSLFLWTARLRKDVVLSGNLVSSVIKMRYEGQQVIFGGDAGRIVLQECLDEFDRQHQNSEGPCFQSSRASLIKASHHGSVQSSSVELWERILASRSRSCVALSAGRNYRFKHPGRETISHIKQAARHLQTKADLLTTNLCDKCLNQPGLDIEHFGCFPKAPLRSKHDESNLAVVGEAPISGSNLKPSKSLEVQSSVVAYRPARLVRQRPKEVVSLAGYIFRLDPERTEARVTYATMPFTTSRNCFFGGRSEQIFPECALPTRRNI